MRRPNARVLGGCAAALLLCGGLVLLTCYDQHWSRDLRAHVLHQFTTFMGQTVFEGERVGGGDLATLFQILCVVFYLAALRAPADSQLAVWRPYLGFMLCVVLVANLMMVHTLKWALGRARPVVVAEHGLPFTHWFQWGPHLITGGLYRGSFPSGHTASVMTFLGVAWLPFRRGGRTVVVLLISAYGLAMAVARTMLGSHWISDGVLAVILCGGLIAVLYNWGLRVPDQLAYRESLGRLPDLPRAWELRLCLWVGACCLGAVLLTFGLRAGLGRLWAWSALALPGTGLLVLGVGGLRRIRRRLAQALATGTRGAQETALAVRGGWRLPQWAACAWFWGPLVCCVGGFLAVTLGKDINWDLRNYHHYNAYAFLNQRWPLDIAPAQLQTFHNPLLDLPFYLMTLRLPPWVIGFILGAVQSVNLILVYKIWRALSPVRDRWPLFLGAGALIFMTAMAPGFWAELGTTLGDNLVSLFALGGLLWVLRILRGLPSGPHRPALQAGLAGGVLGLGIGLKLTLAVYGLGLLGALTVHALVWQPRARRLPIPFAAGLLAGAMLSGGYWAAWLYASHGNPLFPYYNDLFQSPLVRAHDFVDRRFLPRQAWEYFVWPLIMTFKSSRVSEQSFADFRFLLLFVGAIGWGLQSWHRRRHGRVPGALPADEERVFFDPDRSRLVLLFMGLTFVLWMFQSAYYRYLMTLEMLAPLGIAMLVHRIWRTADKRRWVLAVSALVALHVVHPTDWGRSAWGPTYFARGDLPLNVPQASLVIMLGGSPTAYVIPRFPASVRFVRPQGNLGLARTDGLLQHMQSVVKTHRGASFALYDQIDAAQVSDGLALLGLSRKPGVCAPLETGFGDRLVLCRLSP